MRQRSIIDNQTGIHQMKCSLYHQISDRMNITRTDQVYVYPRRTYRHHIRHNPYMLTVPNEQKTAKIELNDVNDLINSSEQQKTSNENFNHNNSSEIKVEPVINFNEDQVVIPNEHISTNKINKRRVMINLNCSNCQQKFKTKNQLNSHLVKCQYETEQR